MMIVIRKVQKNVVTWIMTMMCCGSVLVSRKYVAMGDTDNQISCIVIE